MGSLIVREPPQGSFLIDQLSDLVEEAVLTEFERIADRGGVLGAMETGYQRGRIQDESKLCEQRKHDGTLSLIGVNTFLADTGSAPVTVELARATEGEKQSRLLRLSVPSRLPRTPRRGRATSAGAPQTRRHQRREPLRSLLEAVRHCSLGQISDAFFEVGGQYWRNV